jgi:hypothetical protein
MKMLVAIAAMLFSIVANACPAGAMSSGWCWPTEAGGWGTGFLNWNGSNSDYPGQFHVGKDIPPGSNYTENDPQKLRVGRKVFAIGPGMVVKASNSVGGYGGVGVVGAALIIRHYDGEGREFDVLYGHLDSVTSNPALAIGKAISAGQYLGTLNDYGSGSVHLHLGIAYPKWSSQELDSGNIWAGYSSSSGMSRWADPKTFLADSSQPASKLNVRSVGSIAWYPDSKTCQSADRWFNEGVEVQSSSVCNGVPASYYSCPMQMVDWPQDEDAPWYDSWLRALNSAFGGTASADGSVSISCDSSSVKRTILVYAPSKTLIISGPGAMSSDLLGQGYLRPIAGALVPTPKPDFVVKDVWLTTPWGPEVYKYGLLESINTKAQSGNTGEGSCLAGEKDTIIGHFYLSQGYKEDAHGDWRKVDSTETQCSNLKPGDTNTETKNTVISDWITTPGIYNIVYCIDHPKTEQNNGGDHAEKHESNNCSTEAVFEVTGNSYENTTNIDLVASQLQFRGTPPVYAADSIRLGAWITNAGTQGLYTDIRSSYGVSCNGSPQIQLADDGTEANLLGPGMNAWEEILSPATLPNVSGSCVATFCADSLGYINEVNKANNCTSLGFNLLPRTNLPDLITHSAGIAGGKTRVKAGDKIVPAFYTQNIGNTRPSVTTQALFQYRGPQTGNLWVNLATEANEAKYLDPGKQRRGEWSNGFRISTRGLYQFQICADYLLQQPEISESNNCSVSGWFEVY